MITIDRSTAIALLTAAIDERGTDYVYEPPGDEDWETRCLYAQYGKPSCGVGLALSKAGVSIEELERLDRAGLGAFPVTPGLYELFRWGLTSVTVTYGGAEVFNSFQKAQDIGNTWGTAFRTALENA